MCTGIIFLAAAENNLHFKNTHVRVDTAQVSGFQSGPRLTNWQAKILRHARTRIRAKWWSARFLLQYA